MHRIRATTFASPVHDGREQSSPSPAHCSSECSAGKAASITFADAVAEGSDPPLHSPRSEPRKCLHRYVLSYPVQADGGQAPPVSPHTSGIQTAESRACTTRPGSFTATLLHHGCCLAHIWELQTLYWLHSNLCREGNNFRVQKKERASLLCLCFQ